MSYSVRATCVRHAADIGLGDGWLVPAPLHHISKDGNKLSTFVALPGLPELFAKLRGNA